MTHVCGSTVSYRPIKILFKLQQHMYTYMYGERQSDRQREKERQTERQKDRLDLLPGLNIDIMEIHF